MHRRHDFAFPARRAVLLAAVGSALLLPLLAAGFPITEGQRSTAQRVAQSGVPLSELAPNAPDTYTVKRGDTLWGISALYLKRPWRWPELWGMNLDQIRNPHLIYPGQVLVLEKSGGQARLRFGTGGAADTTIKLSPRVRSSTFTGEAVASIPLNLIVPFMNEAVIFEADELQVAPRIVATPQDSILVSRGDLAYARGELGPQREYRVFREARPMHDPTTGEVLGFEAAFVGTAEYIRKGETRTGPDGNVEVIPATLKIISGRQEIGVGDRLAPVPPRDFVNYVPHEPPAPLEGQIVSIYGEGLTAGQNQIVSLNRGAADGIEPGFVLALWHKGRVVTDPTDPGRQELVLPDEREGTLFVFRVFNRMSYALILEAANPIKAGDRFTQP